jgi:hypothetical protein
MKILSLRSGKQYDPKVVDALAQLAPDADNPTAVAVDAKRILAHLNGVTVASQVNLARI